MKNIIILHDFDGKPYFKALEQVADVTYLNTRPFRFMLRDIIKYRRVQRETLNSLLFLFTLPFLSNKTILLGMAPFNWRIVIYGWLCKRNRVLLHTSWHQWDGKVPFEYASPLRGWLQKAWRWFLPRFAGAVAVTRETARSLSAFVPQLADRIVTIPHVVDITPIDRQAFLLKWQRAPEHFLFTGRLTAAKGVSQFLEAAECGARTSDTLHFHIAGRGECEAEIRDYLANHQNLTFHGFISDRERLRELMAQSHFFLLPSRRVDGWEELFGLVIIEAMSQGCVVIASDHIGPREIIADGEDGILLTEERFSPEVSKLIATLSVHDPLYVSQAERALMTSANYSVEIVSSKWSSLLDGL